MFGLGFSFIQPEEFFGDLPEISPAVEITAETGIELDTGDGAMLTES